MEFCYLCCFIVVVEEFYFVCVVEWLYIEQFLLLWVIKELEEELGVMLFVCIMCSIWLICVGELFLEYVCCVFFVLEQVCDSVKVVVNGFYGQLCVVLFDGIMLLCFFVLFVFCCQEEFEVEIWFFEVFLL